MPEKTTDSLRPAVAVLAELVAGFPDLPTPHVILHQEPELGITLQLSRGCDVEAWRHDLAIDPARMVLHLYANSAWVEAVVTIGWVRVQLTGELPVSGEAAAVSPAEDVARRHRTAQLTEQRQQLVDAAPSASVAPVSVVLLADPVGAA